MIAKARRQAATLRGMAHLDTHELSGTVLLAGSGRSGTTWLGQIINHANAYRDLFEPLHPHRNPQLSDWPMLRYLPAQDADSEHGQVIRALLAGRIRSPWTDARNRKHLVNRRLIKAIRSNLLLGWIAQHCPQVQLLFALRHPCAAVHSRIKLGWDTHLDELIQQPALMDDHLEPFREQIERIAFQGDAWDRQMMMWCIENFIPLAQLQAGDAHVLFYENFCENFDAEVTSLFAFLGRAVPNGIERARKQRSAHFRRDSAIMRGGDLIGDWQSRVSTTQVDRTLEMLHSFGLHHLYDERAMPQCSRDDVFIASPGPIGQTLLRKDAA